MDQGLANEDIKAEEVELEELIKKETKEREPSTGDIQEKTEGKESSAGDIQEKTEGKKPSAGDHSARSKGESAEVVDQGLANKDIEVEEAELEELIKKETEEREPSTGDIQEKTEGKEPSRGDSDYGSIKSLGFVEKVISKTFFCMKPRARIGVFFLLTIIQEVVGLISGISTIWLLMRTGFLFEGSVLLLVQEFYLNIMKYEITKFNLFQSLNFMRLKQEIFEFEMCLDSLRDGVPPADQRQ